MASKNAKWSERSNPQATQSVKQQAPSQIGVWCGVDAVERGAICAKQRKPSVERGVIRDRCNLQSVGAGNSGRYQS
jgi:hypothetical protein